MGVCGHTPVLNGLRERALDAMLKDLQKVPPPFPKPKNVSEVTRFYSTDRARRHRLLAGKREYRAATGPHAHTCI